jgi:hypothetical protein
VGELDVVGPADHLQDLLGVTGGLLPPTVTSSARWRSASAWSMAGERGRMQSGGAPEPSWLRGTDSKEAGGEGSPSSSALGGEGEPLMPERARRLRRR